jgi:RNA polymerase sigma factor (sigma-70 family)
MRLLNPVETTDLVQRCRQGDQRAWNRLVDQYGRLIFSIARKYGLDESASDDVVQTVFGILFRQLASLKNPEKLPAWLVQIAHRECWRQRRALASRRKTDLIDRGIGRAEDPEDSGARFELYQKLRDAISQLSERQRAVVTGLFLEVGGSDYSSIAQRIGMPVSSIGPTRDRSLKKLRELLESALQPMAN